MRFITTSTAGTRASASPRSSARSTRKASEKRASVSTAPSATINQRRGPNCRRESRDTGFAAGRGDERVARRAADALADAVHEARGEHQRDRSGEREQRLGERREAVAEENQRFSAPEPIGEHAWE